MTREHMSREQLLALVEELERQLVGAKAGGTARIGLSVAAEADRLISKHREQRLARDEGLYFEGYLGWNGQALVPVSLRSDGRLYILEDDFPPS